MKAFLLVFIGGGMGSVARFGLGKAMNTLSLWPWGTLGANVLACLILGAGLGWASGKGQISETAKWFLLSGFCGGFSTFSTFSGETLQMFQDGKAGMAIFYTIGSFGLCLLAVWAGQWITGGVFKA